MAETSKRNWPWKKKTPDKFTSALESIESSPPSSPHNYKFFDEQDVSKILSDHARVSDEAITQWQHSESKLKHLIDKLNAAQTELTTKDILVKQHVKVAEEAVTGWEKAEAEASAMKTQLDTAIHQKLATEDRVSHLDGALKECMRQLRHVREDQEVRIHETIIKKTREYDKLRQDMEAKLAEAVRHLQDACLEALDSRAEAQSMSISLQERTKALAEAVDVKACAETEIKILQAQLQSTEKENSILKYELHLLSKEVEIRNVERDCERRVAANAGKNQLENVKKIARLEVECQKLRILVRKKLPGPAALAQMKVEVDALDTNGGGVDFQRRRSLGRSASTSTKDLDNTVKLSEDSCRYGHLNVRDADNLPIRLMEMDDELKLLKEALAKRDEELQASRLMCAKTASKLSIVEEQLEATVGMSKRKNIQLCLVCQRLGLTKRNELANTWNSTSALLAELADFKKSADKELEMGRLDLVDDFTEIERLAIATENSSVSNTQHEASEMSFDAVADFLRRKLLATETELEEAYSMCKKVNGQLMRAKEELSVVRSRNAANEAALIKLQEKMDKLCDKQGNDGNYKDRSITNELEDLVEAQSVAVQAGAADILMLYNIEGRSHYADEVISFAKRPLSSRSSSELRYEASEHSASVLSDSESKANTRDPDLLTTVRSFIEAAEALAEVTGLGRDLSSLKSGHPNAVRLERQGNTLTQWKHSRLDHRIESLIGVSSKLLHGETDMADFLTELTGAVSYIVRICSKYVIYSEASRETLADFSYSTEMGNEFERHPPAKVELECDTCLDKWEDFDDPETFEGENASNGGLEIAEKRFEGMGTQFDGAESTSDTLTFHVECKLQSTPPDNKLDRDMFMLLEKVVVHEEELEDERKQHVGSAAKYRELQQNIVD